MLDKYTQDFEDILMQSINMSATTCVVKTVNINVTDL